MFKQGQELEDAGLYEQAANAYMESLQRDDENIEALIALKSTAQLVLNEKYSTFFRAVQSGDDEIAVKNYVAAENFRERLKQFNIQIERPVGYESDYIRVSEKYCNKKYQEGRAALGNKDYESAEFAFLEIRNLNPDFKDVSELLRLSQAQPKYNLAIEAYDNRSYRQAYYLFEELEQIHGTFENSSTLKATCLRNGQFGLGILSFQNHSSQSGVEALISSKITRQLQNRSDPFLKLIDRSMISEITEEQIRAMSGLSDPRSAAEAGKIVGAKAILVGDLIDVSIEQGRSQRSRQPGYTSRTVRRTNSEGKHYNETVYSKVWYYYTEQESRVSAVFQFKLIDVSTGAILTTNAVNITKEDKVQYAFYNGDTRNLYMGEWASIDEDKAGDRVLNSYSNKRQLDNLLSARKELQSIEELKEALYSGISQKVANEIYDVYLELQD